MYIPRTIGPPIHAACPTMFLTSQSPAGSQHRRGRTTPLSLAVPGLTTPGLMAIASRLANSALLVKPLHVDRAVDKGCVRLPTSTNCMRMHTTSSDLSEIMDLHQSMTLCSVTRTSMNALFLMDEDHQPTPGNRNPSTVSIHLQTLCWLCIPRRISGWNHSSPSGFLIPAMRSNQYLHPGHSDNMVPVHVPLWQYPFPSCFTD